MRKFLAALLAVLAPLVVHATTYTLTPATIAAFAMAKTPVCGDTVALVGTFGNLSYTGVAPSCPITVDLTQAVVETLRWYSSSNINQIGGTLGPQGSQTSFQVEILQSDNNISVKYGHFLEGSAAIGVGQSTNVVIEWNRFKRVATEGDGIDLSSSSNVTIADNVCDFQIGVAGGLHPDCVQIWDVTGEPPLADITIRSNTAVGYLQGYSRFGGDPGPATGIVVADNVAANDSGWCGDMAPVTSSSMANNVCDEIITAADANLNSVGQWVLSDSATAPNASATNVFSGNTTGFVPNTAVTQATPAWMYQQLTALGTLIKNLDATAKASPGSAAAKAASTQAQADLVTLNGWLAKIQATDTQAASVLATATGAASFGGSLAADAAKQAAAAPATPAP
jgi:hypothetical protein